MSLAGGTGSDEEGGGPVSLFQLTPLPLGPFDLWEVCAWLGKKLRDA